jgi:hypothetical protein
MTSAEVTEAAAAAGVIDRYRPGVSGRGSRARG